MLLVAGILLAIFVLDAPWSWLAIVAGGTLDVLENLVLIRWSKRRRAAVGAEALLGRRARAVTPLDPEGQVRLGGELWRARCVAPVGAGEEVVVTAVRGLMLEVEPAP